MFVNWKFERCHFMAGQKQKQVNECNRGQFVCLCAIVITSLNTPIMISNRLMTLQLIVQRIFVEISISISYSGLIFEWNKQHLFLHILAKLCCHDSVLTPVRWMPLFVFVFVYVCNELYRSSSQSSSHCNHTPCQHTFVVYIFT